MRSDTIKKGFERAPHRGLLRACGLKDDDIKKPFIAVAWTMKSLSYRRWVFRVIF